MTKIDLHAYAAYMNEKAHAAGKVTNYDLKTLPLKERYAIVDSAWKTTDKPKCQKLRKQIANNMYGYAGRHGASMRVVISRIAKDISGAGDYWWTGAY